MRIYFAGPLFTAAERDWNVALCGALRAAGHEVFLPQEQEPGKDAAEDQILDEIWQEIETLIESARTFYRDAIIACFQS